MRQAFNFACFPFWKIKMKETLFIIVVTVLILSIIVFAIYKIADSIDNSQIIKEKTRVFAKENNLQVVDIRCNDNYCSIIIRDGNYFSKLTCADYSEGFTCINIK